MIDLSEYEIVEDYSSFNLYTQSMRFKSLRVEKDGVTYAYKTATEEATQPMLANEVAFNRFIETQDVQFAVPRVVEYEGHAALFEWIESPFVAVKDDPDSLTSEKIKSFAELIAAIDGLDSSLFDGITPGHTLKNMDEGFAKWGKQPLEHGLITQTKLDMMLASTLVGAARVGNQLQHGDLTLWHVFDTKPLTIFDTEHSSNQLIRHADFARAYARTYSRISPKSARQLLEATASAFGQSIDDFIQDALPAVTAMAVGVLNDSINDLKHIDYREQAKTLAAAVLQQSLPD